MNEQEFLDNHKQALGKLLGIRFVEASEARVVAEASLGPEHLTEAGAVQGGMVAAIADVAAAYGAVLNLPEGYATATIELKTNFMKRGAGAALWAESTPMHVGRSTAVWRTRVFRGRARGDGACIAEVVQTQLTYPDERPDERAADEQVEEAPSENVAATPAAVERGAEEEEKVVSLADSRRRQILKGAAEVVMRKGFAKASVREIAEAAGMPIPTMYKYVESKEDILAMIYENFLIDINEQLSRSVADDLPPEKRLQLALEATLSTFDRYHDHVKLLFRETKSLSAESRERVFKLDRSYIARWRQIFEDCVRDGSLHADDPELIANFAYYLCTVWAMRHWAIGKYGYETVSRSITRFIMSALRAQRMEELSAVADGRSTRRPAS